MTNLADDTSSSDIASLAPDMRVVAKDTSIMANTCMVVRVYRKCDNFLVREIRARGIAHIYDLTLEEVLKGVAEDATLCAESKKAVGDKDAKKDAKKDTKKGKDSGDAANGEPPFPGSGDLIDLVLDCTIDEYSMNLPLGWRASFPFTFDNGGVATMTEEVAESEMKVEASVASVCPIPKPARKFQWNLDIIGGYISDLSHDIEELEKAAMIKNEWEDKCEGRAERAAAAYAYYKEKKRLLMTHSTPSADGGEKDNDEDSSGKKASEDLVEGLATALGVDASELVEKENALLNIPAYREHVSSSSGDRNLWDTESIQTATEKKREQRDSDQAEASLLIQHYHELNKMLIESISARANFLIEKSNKLVEQNIERWKAREDYRNVAHARNESMKYLIEKARNAREGFDEDGNPVEVDPKKKKK